MSRIRAKFKVTSTSGDQATNGGKTINLQPVYSSDPQSENYTWSQATPSGQIQLFISNPAAADAFELGAEYLVDFTKVEPNASAEG